MGVHWKNLIFRGRSQKTNIYKGELGDLGQFADLRGLGKKKGGGVFEGGLIPQCNYVCNLGWYSVKMCIITLYISNL